MECLKLSIDRINKFEQIKPDIHIYCNNNRVSKEEIEQCLEKFKGKKSIFQDSFNAGYLLGAHTGLKVNYNVCKNYDYVIHLHPDVIFIEESKIFNFLKGALDKDIDFLISEFPEGIEGFGSDFFIFKPKKNHFKDLIDITSAKYVGASPEALLRRYILENNISYFRLPRWDSYNLNPAGKCWFRDRDDIGLCHEHNLDNTLRYLGISPCRKHRGPEGFIQCANEGETYTLSSLSDVAYGLDGRYHYLYNKAGKVTFNNETFGDSFVGVTKSGFYKPL